MEHLRRRRKIAIVAAILSVLLLAGAAIGIFSYQESRLNDVQQAALELLEEEAGNYNEDVILLQGTSKERAEELAARFGASLRITKNGEFAALTLPEGVTVRDIYEDRENRRLLEELSLDFHVYLAEVEDEGEEEEEDGLFRPNYQVEEPDYHLQTYLDYINIGDVWNSTLGKNADGTKVKVAVIDTGIDTGIDTDHPEFYDAEGNCIISTKSYDASNDKIVEMYENDWSIIEDENGHGTAVAGVIAAQMNGVGITGVAPDVELIVIKCEIDEYTGAFKSSADILFGMYYAIEQDVAVINMSLGGEEMDIFQTALELAVDSDVVVVAAAGNKAQRGDTSKMENCCFPAASSLAIGVGALDKNSWKIAPYSNYHDNSDIMAPGTLYVPALGGGYTYQDGTSMSAPIVSAAVALYVAQNKYVTFDTVKAEIEAAGRDLGELGEDEEHGFGCLDVNAFILEEKGKITWDYGTEEMPNTTQVFVRSHTVQTVPDPEREKVILDDWYYDKAYTRPFEYENYYTTVFEEDITLYAKWANEDDEGTSAYTYVTLNDGTVEITGYKGKRRYLTIPDSIDGKTVSSIGKDAFKGNKRLREVTFPTGLVYIQDSAFEEVKNLRKITFTGDRLAEIGKTAFFECTALQAVNIPDSVLKIKPECFAECSSLASVEISESSLLADIGANAFSKTNIKSFYVPRNAKFDGSIFAFCEKMATVRIHPENTAYTVENSTVYNAEQTALLYYPASLKGTYTVKDGVTEIGRFAFASSRVTACTMPDSVRSLGESAFADSSLTSIVLSKGLSTIPKSTFAKSKLVEIEIPAGVHFIDIYAFLECKNLSAVTFAEGSALKTIYDKENGQLVDQGVFQGCGALKSIEFPDGITYVGAFTFRESGLQSITIPKSVSYLGKGAFSSCVALKTAIFEDGCAVTSVPAFCFESCVSLQSVSFSDGIDTLETYCFRACSALDTLNFGEESALHTVANYAFYSCASLKELQLPDGVTEIGELAFAFSGLRRVEIPAGLTTLGKGAFGACYDLTELTVPAENAYFAAIDNVLFDAQITIVYCVPSSSVGAYALPDTVTVIGQYAFYYNKFLTEVTLPDGLEEIREYAFYYCTLLTEMQIPASVFTIGRYGFANCRLLKDVTIAEGSVLERLGYATFYFCSIEQFTVPASVTSMAQYVFSNCYQLQKITFAANSKLSSISAYMFAGCSALTEIVFEGGSALTSLQARAFSGMYNLRRVDFGDAKITNVDNYAFYRCFALQEIRLPATVTYVGGYAFWGCSSLERVDIPATVEYIGESAFYTPSAKIKLFFATELLPAYVQPNWDSGIAGYFLNAKEYVITDTWEYAITNNDTVAIARYLGDASTLTLDVIDGMAVEKIGAKAFYNNDTLTSVSISNTVLEIGNYAFADCDGLATLVVPAAVKRIGDHAFRGSSANVVLAADGALAVIGEYAFASNETATLTLPDAVTEIGDYAFYNSALEVLTIGEQSKLALIGKYAFAGSSLGTIALPATMTKIDDDAFLNVTSLSSVTIAEGGSPLRIGHSAFNNTGIVEITLPANVNYIGEYAFGSNQKLQNIYVDDQNETYTSFEGLLCDITGTTLIQYPTGRAGAFEVPAEITVLTYASFKDARGLTEVSFEEGSIVKTIGWQTFSGCSALTRITVPDTCVSFDFYAFENCTALTDVVLGENSALSGVYKGAFYNCSSLCNIMLPATVAEFAEYAFYQCTSLTVFPICEGVAIKGIYDYAFYGCSGITEIPHFPQLVEIGEYAFAKTGVTEYTLPATVLKIESSTFAYSYELSGIYVENGNTAYTSIDGGLFEYGASSLADIDALVIWPCALPYTVGEGKTVLDSTASNAVKKLLSVGVVDFQIADTVTSIGNNTFSGYSSLASITIPESVTSIGAYAFYDCTSLTSITIPESVTSIGMYAFNGCSKLTICFVADGLPTDLGRYWNGMASYFTSFSEVVTFADATYVITKDGLAYLGKYFGADRTYSILTQVDNLNVVGIGNYAFYNCSSLTSITIPENVTSIGEAAFSGCRSLTEINFNAVAMNDLASRNRVFSYAGQSGAGITVNFGANVTKIPAYLFFSEVSNSSAIPNIVTVTFADNSVCESIGYAAFYDCSSLTSITIPERVTSIGNSAFFNCTALTEINFNAIAMNDLTTHVFFRGGQSGDGITVNVGAEVTKIPAYLFAYTDVVSVIFAENSACESIGSSAFSECSSLTSIAIPEGVTSIGEYTFSGCSLLTSITIPEGVTGRGGCHLPQQVLQRG